METPPGAGSIHAAGLCDDVLAEILARLPSGSVFRCRAVCKRWRRITTDRSFLAAHAAHAASCTREMIILPRYEPLAVQTIRLSLDPMPGDGRRRFLCNRRHGNRCRVLYSLDGLLVLEPRHSRYIICNPTTRQLTNLPLLTPEPCFTAFPCGFYFHSSSNEYRLLCHCLLQGETEAARRSRCSVWHRERYYYILSTGSTLPRRLGRAPTPTPWPPITEYDLPVAHRGILHWFSLHPEATNTGKMLAFHMVSETFRLMSRPPERAGDTMRTLFELDGELCVAAMQSVTSLDIWVLQDYKAESWMLRHRVEVPRPTLLGDSNVVTVRMVLSVGSGAILIGDPYCGVARLYNLKEKKMHRDIIFGPAFPTFLLFTESLVSHAFFESPPHPEFVSISFSERR